MKGPRSTWRSREALAQHCLQSWQAAQESGWLTGETAQSWAWLCQVRRWKEGAFWGGRWYIQQLVVLGGWGEGVGERRSGVCVKEKESLTEKVLQEPRSRGLKGCWRGPRGTAGRGFHRPVFP